VGRQVPLPAEPGHGAAASRSGHRDVPAHQKANLTESCYPKGTNHHPAPGTGYFFLDAAPPGRQLPPE